MRGPGYKTCAFSLDLTHRLFSLAPLLSPPALGIPQYHRLSRCCHHAQCPRCRSTVVHRYDLPPVSAASLSTFYLPAPPPPLLLRPPSLMTEHLYRRHYGRHPRLGVQAFVRAHSSGTKLYICSRDTALLSATASPDDLLGGAVPVAQSRRLGRMGSPTWVKRLWFGRFDYRQDCGLLCGCAIPWTHGPLGWNHKQQSSGIGTRAYI
jgi:hypothetical protein